MLNRRTLFSMAARVFGGFSILPFIGEKKAAGDIPREIASGSVYLSSENEHIKNIPYCIKRISSHKNVVSVRYEPPEYFDSKMCDMEHVDFDNNIGGFVIRTNDTD